MLLRRLSRAMLGLALLAGVSAAQSPSLDVEGSVWTAPEATVRLATRIKSLPADLAPTTGPAQLRFDSERWLLLTDGAPLAEGLWLHAAPTQTRIQLSLDEAGARLLEQRLTEAVRQRAEAAGLDAIVVATRLHKTRWRFKLVPDGSGMFYTAAMSATIRARGEVQGVIGGLAFARPWSARIKLRTHSDPVLAQNLLVDPDPGPPEPAVADFVVGSSAGVAPFTVHFANTSQGSIDAHQWEFGDGTLSASEHPVHVIETPGLFEVGLTVSGPLGSDTRTRSIVVAPGVAPPLPQSTLYPALLGLNNTLPRMVQTLGWESYFYVGMTGGFGWKFLYDFEGHSNQGRAYQVVLGMDAAHPQKVRVTVNVRRNETNIVQTLFGPITFAVKGSPAEVPPIESFFVSTLDGPVLDAQPGDRIFFELENISTTFKKNGNLRVHLGLCSLKLPELD